MKKCILFCMITLGITQSNAQDAHKLIRKMSEQLRKLKSLKCELSYTCISDYDTTYAKVYGSFVFNQQSKLKPLPAKHRYSFVYTKDTTYQNHDIIAGNQITKIKDYTKEILNGSLSKSSLYDYWNRLDDYFGPFYFDTKLRYLDSMFQKQYTSRDTFYNQIKYSVSRDTDCLSGDCYKIVYSFPSEMGTCPIAYPDSTIWFKDEVSEIWMNVKNYYPEKYKVYRTLENGRNFMYTEYNYIRFEVNKPIPDSEYLFDIKKYPTYRVEKRVNDTAYKTIQEAFKKAPDFKGITQFGDSLRLFVNKSKLYLLDFWFANCPPCLDAAKFIESEIYAKYSQEEVMAIGINPKDKSIAEIKKILGENIPKYPFIFNKQAAKDYHLSAYPGIYLLNSKFEVIQSWNCYGEYVKKQIIDLIKKNLK